VGDFATKLHHVAMGLHCFPRNYTNVMAEGIPEKKVLPRNYTMEDVAIQHFIAAACLRTA
jgi:hypothetical protein